SALLGGTLLRRALLSRAFFGRLRCGCRGSGLLIVRRSVARADHAKQEDGRQKGRKNLLHVHVTPFLSQVIVSGFPASNLAVRLLNPSPFGCLGKNISHCASGRRRGTHIQRTVPVDPPCGGGVTAGGGFAFGGVTPGIPGIKTGGNIFCIFGAVCC